MTKAAFYKFYPLKANGPNTWQWIDNAKHARKRRILNYFFSENAMRFAEKFAIQHVDLWCEPLGENAEKEWSKPRDMATWANYLVFNILGNLCFGNSMQMKEPGKTNSKPCHI